MEPSQRRWTRIDALAVGLVVVAAAAIRLAYLGRLELPPYDPWRHMLLVEAVRDGRGFTLFDGQPYLWYAPWWHTLVAWLPARLGAVGAATVLSSLVPGALYGLVRVREGSVGAATLAGCVAAALGPLTAFTCHHGSEAAATLLLSAGALLAWTGRGPRSAGAAGLLAGAGLVLRLNFLFDLLLLAPVLRSRGRTVAAAAGTAAPLAWLWWRNRRIIGGHDWLFTWDGLATPTDGFGLLGPLLPQRHPDVAAALARLHELIVPWPEWIRGPDGWRPDTIAFMALAIGLVLASRRLDLIGACLGAAAYFLLLDGTGSSHFFRIYLPLMLPVVLAAGALTAAALRSPGGARRVAVLAAVAALVPLGGRYLSPPPMVGIDTVTPPAALIRDVPALFVNSTFYHPESVMYAHPERRILGLPLRADELPAFLAAYPDVRAAIWHEPSVQDEVLRALVERHGWRVADRRRNDAGRRYTLLLAPGRP